MLKVSIIMTATIQHWDPSMSTIIENPCPDMSGDDSPHHTEASLCRMQADHIQRLHAIGAALSAEHDLDRLLVMILSQAKQFTHADGGTLYLKSDDDKQLEFTVVESDSLNIRMGGTHGQMAWTPIDLYTAGGTWNRKMVASLCALTGEVINIKDVYNQEGFNFEGTKAFDRKTGFRSRSMIVVPMKNHENEVIGVCQLINRQIPGTRTVIPFGPDDEQSTLSLASLAAVAITNAKLINDMRVLLEAFISSISSVIDAKSPYTGGHVRKVADLTMRMAEKINTTGHGIYGDVHFDFDQLNELKIAALMHDVGKIATPEYVVDKSTKLETICDRMELIRTRYEVIKRDMAIEWLKDRQTASDTGDRASVLEADRRYDLQLSELAEELTFLETANLASRRITAHDIDRIREIAGRAWNDNGVTKPLLSEEEVENLSIINGTLNRKEREIIRAHARMSLVMLGRLPFPKKLKRIPEIAGAHHEKLNGKGYPRGLSGETLSLESRILALADIFEALTASDRPYKDANTLTQVKTILQHMVTAGELDRDLVQFFYDRNIHLEYADKELMPDQIDTESRKTTEKG